MGSRTSKSKYGNRKVSYDGYKFDSVREYERYQELCLLEKAGEITKLEVQPKFPLVCGGVEVRIRSERYPNGRKVSYYGDFSYYDVKAKQKRIEDVKGMDTPVSRLKRALVETMYGIPVTIVR